MRAFLVIVLVALLIAIGIDSAWNGRSTGQPIPAKEAPKVLEPAAFEASRETTIHGDPEAVERPSREIREEVDGSVEQTLRLATLLCKARVSSFEFPCQWSSENGFVLHESDLEDSLSHFEQREIGIRTPIPEHDRLVLFLDPEESQGQFLQAASVHSGSTKTVWSASEQAPELGDQEIMLLPPPEQYRYYRSGIGIGEVSRTGEGRFTPRKSRHEKDEILSWLYVVKDIQGRYYLWFDEEEIPTVTLIYRAESESLPLHLRWFSQKSLTYEGEPSLQDDGSIHYPNGKISPDVFTLNEEDLLRALEKLEPLRAPISRLVPRDDRLLLHLDSKTTIATFTHAAFRFKDFGSEGNRVEIVRPWAKSDPRSQLPRNETPPQAKLWMIKSKSKLYEVDNELGRSDEAQYGLGVGCLFHDDRGFFAPRKATDERPDGSKAWLCVGRDENGDYWLWWEE